MPGFYGKPRCRRQPLVVTNVKRERACPAQSTAAVGSSTQSPGSVTATRAISCLFIDAVSRSMSSLPLGLLTRRAGPEECLNHEVNQLWGDLRNTRPREAISLHSPLLDMSKEKVRPFLGKQDAFEDDLTRGLLAKDLIDPPPEFLNRFRLAT
jgi:hypothetical protein